MATVLNVLLLGGLIYVWGRNYRKHRAQHTLGLLLFACFLFLQNTVAFYLYTFQPTFYGWFHSGPPAAQYGIMIQTVLELLAVVALTRVTWI